MIGRTLGHYQVLEELTEGRQRARFAGPGRRGLRHRRGGAALERMAELAGKVTALGRRFASYALLTEMTQPAVEWTGVAIALESLHPFYAADRSLLNTIAQSQAWCETQDPEGRYYGIAVDAYHVWRDPLPTPSIAGAGPRSRSRSSPAIAAGRKTGCRASDLPRTPADGLLRGNRPWKSKSSSRGGNAVACRGPRSG